MFSTLICFFPSFLALCHVCKSYYSNVLKEKIKLGKKFRILIGAKNGLPTVVKILHVHDLQISSLLP